ncbi:MAG: zinc-ribbon domain-containing protein [Deltaproteobacteria bacterium]|nr:zinc-ribbon domain-containing protein [Deltaproteobacteria bacterium]
MIIECDKCESTFRLDESLIKKGGSKVRCSVCKNVFMVYPPKEDAGLEKGTGLAPEEEEDYTETATLSSVKTEEDRGPKSEQEADFHEFDTAFKELLEEDITEKTASSLSPEGDLSEEEEPAEVPPPEKKAVEEKRRIGIRPLPVALAILLLLVVAGGGVYYFMPELIPEPLSILKPASKQQISDPGTRRLTFSGVSGSFVQSSKAGQLFVIRGMVKNEYPKARSFVLVKGTVLDDRDQPVRTEMAYAGNVLTEKQIREMTLEEIKKSLKNRLGKGNMNLKIQSGSSIPFMIVLGNLPPNLSEFQVEAVRSSPAE